MIIEQINDDVVITRGEYTFTFFGHTLDSMLNWEIGCFLGCNANQDFRVILDLSEFEYKSIIDQIRKAL